MRRDGGVIALRAGRLEATTDLIVHLVLARAVRQTPRRLALWRIRALDRFLRQAEELRLQGERGLPDELRRDLLAFAARHDPGLLAAVGRNSPGDLNTVHEALFDAQGRVMMALATLRRVPNWVEVDREVDPEADLLESQAA